jgi:putative transposase
MGWAISTFLDTLPCLDALTMALKEGVPEIINSDQGCQFTSTLWVNVLTEKSIKISMDGKGRWADNVYVERLWRSIKYENVFLHSFDSVIEAKLVLQKYITFYNQKRPHQNLNYHTPDIVYMLKTIPTKQELFYSFLKQNIASLENAMFS